jgi:DNA repair protein RecO (recombination protein O)
MLRWEQMAYVLHIEPFKETSGLVHFLTKDHGHVLAVARGIKRRRLRQAMLQPFIAWQIRVQGRGELLTLTDYQACRYWPAPLNYEISVSCIYVHELLIRLLRGNDSAASVFDAYEGVLERLLSENAFAQLIPLALRLFEKQLLAALGYGLPLTHEPVSMRPVEPDHYYVFDPLRGPGQVLSTTPGAVRGESLLALENGIFENAQQLQEAKKLTRSALRAQLGDKPLQSQRLWLTKTHRKKEECDQLHE